MKRDMDLVRELLLKLEALPLRHGAVAFISADDEEIQIEGYDADQIGYHLDLIKKTGFIDGVNASPMRGISFRCLTWEGHDFLDSVRDPEVWKKTKKGAAAAGGFTVELLRDLAKGLLKKQLEDYTGVKL